MTPEQELKELQDLVRQYFLAIAERDSYGNSGINYLVVVEIQNLEDKLKQKVGL